MRETLRQGLQLIGRNQRKRWILLTLLALVVSGFEMVGAVLVYALLNLVVDPQGPIEVPLLGDLRLLAGGADEEELYAIVLVSVAVFFLIRAFARVGTKYLQSRIAYNAGARLANRLVEGYLSMPYSRHLMTTSASLIRNGHQATLQLVTGVFIPLIRVTAEAIMTVGLLVVMVAIAPAATGVAVLIMGGAAAILILFVQPKLKWIGKMAHRMSKVTLGSMQQSLQGIRDIKLLGRERYFVRQYSDARLTLARMNYLRSAVGELPTVVMESALIGFILISFAIAVFGGAGAGDFLSVVGLFAYVGMRLQPSLANIIGGLNELKHSTAPLADLHRDLMLIQSLPTTVGDVAPLPFERELRLENVSYQYDNTDQPALRNVNLTVRPGEQIGICGPTGGGKSTLVDLIAGLLEPTEGRVTVDDVDIATHTREWQRNLGVVSQMVFLVDDTVRRNVAFGVPDDEIDEEAVQQAIELAQLSDFIASLPNGLDTEVGERGVRVSGGQRQRIAIARALYHRPAVLIFDEGTSALDNATEHHLMEAIEQLRGQHTIILVAHRLSTVRNSDRVIYVEAGTIAGEGTYSSLYGENESFRALATAQ